MLKCRTLNHASAVKWRNMFFFHTSDSLERHLFTRKVLVYTAVELRLSKCIFSRLIPSFCLKKMWGVECQQRARLIGTPQAAHANRWRRPHLWVRLQSWKGKVSRSEMKRKSRHQLLRIRTDTHTHTHSSWGSLSPKYRAAGVRGLFIWGKKTAISRWWLTNGKSYKSQHVFPRLFPQGDFEPLLFWKRLSQVFCFSSPWRAAGTFVCILLFFFFFSKGVVVGGVEGQPVSQFFESHVSPPVE